MTARIYQPARNAMQSGTANSKTWVLEFSPHLRKTIDPLMGWVGSSDMERQVKLRFETKDHAIEYAEKHGLPYHVDEAKSRKANIRQLGYGENFVPNRRMPWTH